ncbi:hypothetical protein BD311DRAFT_731556 [Dichomitus squalens]|uniref:Uncharacterized protein n=1 Tax=Dichomitus squalens TaxID=114155 RepID=A0A4V2JZ23_9APHY|nr:hypothetical protein BD311DRAFT_731556 [Dichomitus squalens]
MAAAAIPPAPVLSANGQLEVFVHHSSPAAFSQDAMPYGNSERLRTLGKRMLETAYMAAVRAKYPALGHHQLEQHVVNEYPAFIAHWVNAYGWRARMRAVPQGVDLNDPQEMQMIFETYAGAVVAEDGTTILFDWVKRLVAISD